MKKVNANQQIHFAYENYLKSKKTLLSHCYSNYSNAKLSAYNYCRALFNELGGRNFRIITYNSNTFSVGFEFADVNSGELCFAYITKHYDRYCMIPYDWIK